MRNGCGGCVRECWNLEGYNFAIDAHTYAPCLRVLFYFQLYPSWDHHWQIRKRPRPRFAGRRRSFCQEILQVCFQCGLPRYNSIHHVLSLSPAILTGRVLWHLPDRRMIHLTLNLETCLNLYAPKQYFMLLKTFLFSKIYGFCSLNVRDDQLWSKFCYAALASLHGTVAAMPKKMQVWKMSKRLSPNIASCSRTARQKDETTKRPNWRGAPRQGLHRSRLGDKKDLSFLCTLSAKGLSPSYD